MAAEVQPPNLPSGYVPTVVDVKSKPAEPFKTSVRLTEFEEEKIEWEERPTCWVSKGPQGGKLWKRLRIGGLNSSGIAHYINRVPAFMRKTPDESARIILGISKESYDEEKALNMGIGVHGEPIVRDWDAEINLKMPILQVGVAVWKKDPRFRGSIDGEPKGRPDLAVEYKIPKHMYRKLIEHLEAIKKGFQPPPGYHKHIFDSHYDQMTQNGVIMDKTATKYTVVAADTHEVYEQWLPTDHDHWNKVLYPRGVQLYDEYVEPLMEKMQIFRIDP